MAADARRWRSLDVLRGATVALMILVNNQGDGSHVFGGLAHAHWNGWTLADLVFPAFLFIMGASMAIAGQPVDLWRSARRGITLIAIGLAVQALPHVNWAELRYPGVLQRLGLTYFLAALVLRVADLRRQVVIAVVVVVGYVLLLRLVPFGGHAGGTITPAANLPGWLDQHIFGKRHVYGNGGYDPEGLLSSLPATVNVLAGTWCARWLRRSSTRSTCLQMGAVGALAMVAGQLASHLVPINKRLWTSSFTVLSIGASMIALAATVAVVDARAAATGTHRREWAAFVPLGRNALLAFVGSEELHYLLTRWHAVGTNQTWRHWWNATINRITTPDVASLIYALTILAIFAVVCRLLHARRIYWRV